LPIPPSRPPCGHGEGDRVPVEGELVAADELQKRQEVALRRDRIIAGVKPPRGYDGIDGDIESPVRQLTELADLFRSPAVSGETSPRRFC
jgi:hypothetical protein